MFFARSLDDPRLGVAASTAGALQAPGLTVLVPHYGETILQSAADLTDSAEKVLERQNERARRKDMKERRTEALRRTSQSRRRTWSRKLSLASHYKRIEAEARESERSTAEETTELWRGRTERSGRRRWATIRRFHLKKHMTKIGGEWHHDDLQSSVIGFLIRYFADEWENFIARASVSGDVEAAHTASRNSAEFEEERRVLMLRKWASMRLQTLYRTLVGMMKHRHGLILLLQSQLPTLGRAEVERLADAKFRLVAALQRYGVMRPDELADVEILLAEFPMLSIAYIEEEDSPASGADGRPTRRFFSCLVDGSCELDVATNRRMAKYRVELPGHPILGNGKSDNQNHAIVFTRGQ
eukprot:14821-Prymnesium_polylepis.1